MNFEFDESQEMLRSTVRKLSEKELSLEATRNGEKTGEYPFALDSTLAELGLYALPFPEELGGINLGLIDFGIVAEELGRCSLDIALSYGLNLVHGLDILACGTEAQKTEYIPQLIEGSLSFSPFMPEQPYAEPTVDADYPKAVAEGDNYRIDSGCFYSVRNGGKNNVIALIARTGEGTEKGLSVFLVPTNSAGLTVKKLDPLGLKVLGINEITIKGLKIPKGNLLGELNNGWEVVKHGMELKRLFTSFAYVGNAQRIVEMATQYAKEREQFGQPVGNFQSVGHMLARMQVRAEAGKLVAYRTAWMKQNGYDCAKEISAARVVTSEALVENAHDGMFVMGGYGYSREYDVERFARGARITTFMDGPTYVHRNIIGNLLVNQL